MPPTNVLKGPETPELSDEKRKLPRHAGRAVIEIIREQDPLRRALRAELVEFSLNGLGLVTSHAYKQGERVRIRLRNDIQRFVKEVPGFIRWTRPAGNGRSRLGIELANALAPADLPILKRVGNPTPDGGSLWI